jgi:uncharacterized protein YndB with AHSA1/START domain
MTATLTLTRPSEREVMMTRVFDAPRALVFETLTKPEYVQRWLLGPPGWTMPVCEIDLKVGGKFRYVWENTAGKKMGIRGTYREVTPPERIVHTEQFDDPWYPGEALATTILAEKDGKTTLTLTVRHDSSETVEGILKSGMERGVAASYDRLAEILATM